MFYYLSGLIRERVAWIAGSNMLDVGDTKEKLIDANRGNAYQGQGKFA